ncbi:MAG: Guanosine-diphosphatase [Thelocarpon impressellum]|nr:MAG: Guanosine-diphosphatase [Thelocarpon impressellum]
MAGFRSLSPRRQSTSLPTQSSLHDPHEKADRHADGAGNGGASLNMTQGQRSRYLKLGGLIAFIIILFFYLSPNGNSVAQFVGNSKSEGQSVSDPAVGITKCTKSSDPSKPLIQYALMIDAGSTGSRIHVYRFNNCGSTPELEAEEFKMTEPKPGGAGLSSYKDDAEGAAKSLDVLLEVALKTVPESLRSCSPIAVKATAGLRKLGKDMADKTLEAVRNRLETVYPFPVVSRENGGVQIMDGKDEGVYAWITTNYLLGKIGGPDKKPTAAVFDLGGGSTQIVFQPTFKSPSGGMPEKLEEGDHKYDLKFGGQEFTLYQHSYLGYGLMEARQSVHKMVVESLVEQELLDKSSIKKTILNPCIPPGMTHPVDITLSPEHRLGPKVTVNMTGPAVGSPAQCRGLVEKILEKDAKCELAPCSFRGVHQPSLEKTFAREDVYIFSYFYDRTQPLGMPESFTLRELNDLAARVCAGEAQWGVFSGVEGALRELQDRPEYCLDLSFMITLLHTGYEMPLDREVKIAKKIKGNELGWCLGARSVQPYIHLIITPIDPAATCSLPLLSQESGWKCRVKEVTR